jgi:hypothetical protein
MTQMARLRFGRLSEAWRGEASDFTPLLAAQLDALGEEIGVDLISLGQAEVATAGDRRIDIVAQVSDGSEFVVENQYGRADHDHLTRGLAYAVARRARGLVVVAEEHRDEFRAVAHYLNDLAEREPDRSVFVWLVEAKAVQIEDSPWAPLFSTVVAPNLFTAVVEQANVSTTRVQSVEEFLDLCDASTRLAAKRVIDAWQDAGHRRRFGTDSVVLMASGPAKSRLRTVVVLYADGRVLVPFNSYAGQNSGVAIPSLTTQEFRSGADLLFGFNGTERQPNTAPGWLTIDTAEALVDFCQKVATAYRASLDQAAPG